MLSCEAHALVLVESPDCCCDLRVLTCLPPRHCLFDGANDRQMALGVEVRRHLQKTVMWNDIESSRYADLPPGKMLQYSTVKAWERWAHANTLATGWSRSRSVWVNEVDHSDCVSRGLKGLRCFLRDFTSAEDIYELEGAAQAAYLISPSEAVDAAHHFSTFQRQHPLTNQSMLPPLTYALSFAHLLRLRTNLQPSLQEYYNAHLVVVPGVSSERAYHRSGVLRVGVHMRRSDSCINLRSSPLDHASPMNSTAQISSKRLCYRTAVYIDALQKVCVAYRAFLRVYIATDDHVSILPELRRVKLTDHRTGIACDVEWRLLNHTRGAFKHLVGRYIESHPRKNELGSTAFTDLWHLSHMQYFIGHLGSRFGKVAWLQALALNNKLVPYHSVDGHSVCCEIDENCANATAAMGGMVDCLTFGHELLGVTNKKDYWTHGSTARWMNRKVGPPSP